MGVVIVTTDKGLCGGLNTNLLRMVLMKMREWSDQKIESQVVAIGNKGLGFFSRAGARLCRM